MNVYNNAVEKANDLLKSSNIIKSIKCTYEGSERWYGIKNGTEFGLNNILSVILYTDYDTLSFMFSCTFRQIKPNETIKDLENKNIEYGNWSKYLIQTVNCYGKEIDESDINIFYHGISYMYFDEFIARFNSPTSTTTKLQIATIFAKNNGIILELKKCDPSLRYFNCSFVSCFGNENERLFIQP
eukprot:68104_1